MYDGPIQDLIAELSRLPGVGPKSAQRIAFFLLDADEADVTALAEAIIRAKQTVKFCQICFNATEDETCRICRDPRRDHTKICVVEESKDIVAIERTREFRGVYHVLGGSISPIDNRGPADLHIRELLHRLEDDSVTEIILATNPNTEGEATATYLARLLGPLGLRVSRLASGLPVGGDLEYADEITLGRAFEGRRIISGGEPVHQPEPSGWRAGVAGEVGEVGAHAVVPSAGDLPAPVGGTAESGQNPAPADESTMSLSASAGGQW